MASLSQKFKVAANAAARGALRAAYALTCGEFGKNSLFYAYKMRSEQLQKQAEARSMDSILGYAKSIRMSVNARKFIPAGSQEAEALRDNERKMWRKLAGAAPGQRVEALENAPIGRFRLYFSRSSTVRERIARAFENKCCLNEGYLHSAVSSRVFSGSERLTMSERRRIDRFGVFMRVDGYGRHVEYVGWTCSDGGHWQTKPI